MSENQAVGGKGPWLAFVGCGLIWGSTFLVISIGNDTLPPFWAVTLRLVLASLLFAGVTKLLGHEFPRGPALRAAVLYGVLLFGVNMSFLYWGELTVPSGLSAVLYATVPLSSAILTRLWGMERLNPLKIGGALVAIGGVALIGSSSIGNPARALGLVAILVAATVSGVGTIFLKRGPRQSTFAANAVANAAGVPVALLLSLIAREHWSLPATGSGWFSLLYLVVAGSMGAFAMWSWLIHRWPVTRASFVSVMVPVIAMILGAVVRSEAPSLFSYLGAGLVLVGLMLGMLADRRAPHGSH